MAENAPHLASFWEGRVSWIERLCATSIAKAGHSLAVYSYYPDSLRATGLPVEIRDARDIVSEQVSQSYRNVGRYTLFSNLFRLELQRQGMGIWVDLDCYFLKPLLTNSEYVFGLVGPAKLNGAVLGLPAACLMAEEYMAAITANPLRMPWATFRRRIGREIEILMGKPMPDPLTLTNIGPRALTYFATRHRLMKHAMARHVFYPIASKDAYLLAQSDDRPIRRAIGADTTIVHLWHTRLKRMGLLEELPPKQSYLGKALEFCNV